MKVIEGTMELMFSGPNIFLYALKGVEPFLSLNIKFKTWYN